MYRGWNKQLFHGYMENSEFNCPKGNFKEKPQESDVWGPSQGLIEARAGELVRGPSQETIFFWGFSTTMGQ